MSGNEIKLDSTYDHKAALFAYSEIDQWMPDTNVTGLNISELENFLANKTKTISEPVAFLFKGKITTLSWHVINWTTGDTVHTYKKHKASGLHDTIKDEIVTIFGYYSKNLKGILTHHTSTMHLHFVNETKTIAGHVDDVILGKGILKTNL